MTRSHKARVLVLDAELRHSLAIVRSLGRSGLEVVGASAHRYHPARYSRYTQASYVLTNRGDAEDRVEELLSIVERERIDVVVPAGLAGTEFVCRHRDQLEPRVRAPYNDLGAFMQLADKAETLALAHRLDVPCPRSIRVEDLEMLDDAGRELGYPLVFKSTVDQGTVRYARSPAELRQIGRDFWTGNRDLIAEGRYPLIQQYIEGDGHGFYALSDHGSISAYFMHRRLHEVPPSGGPSAMAASYRDPELMDLGGRFVQATGWTGVAMIEFKRSRRDGRYYLLEANPKFWGSLDLSVAAGVDFPHLLVRMLSGQPLGASLGTYDESCVFRWLTMDLAYAVAARRLGAYVRTFANRRVRDDFAADDFLPFFVLLSRGVVRSVRQTATTHRPPP